jgi:DNA-binding NarL/FixJ family response regulator
MEPDFKERHSSGPGRTGDSEGGFIRLLLVDDNKLFLAGLCSLIQNEPGIKVVAQAVNRAEALEAVRVQPDIILLDLDLGGEDGTDFIPELLSVAERARIVIITGVTDPDLHLRTVLLGAMGVVLKSESAMALIKAIRKVHEGQVWLNRALVSKLVSELVHPGASKKVDPEAAKISSLTPREREIVALVCEGRRNRQVGERLFISEKTVRHYLSSIFAKLGLSDRLELMVYSYQHGLAKVPPPAASGSERVAGNRSVKGSDDNRGDKNGTAPTKL